MEIESQAAMQHIEHDPKFRNSVGIRKSSFKAAQLTRSAGNDIMLESNGESESQVAKQPSSHDQLASLLKAGQATKSRLAARMAMQLSGPGS